MTDNVRILAFTASSKRPIHLRHCIFQMQAQTYSVDHGIYLNSNDYETFEDIHNYAQLIDDIPIKSSNKLLFSYGPTLSHHLNHLSAIRLYDWESYDLFIKIDDDDIYRTHYIRDLVDDYLEHQWDFSGAISHGHIQSEKWLKDQDLRSFNSDQETFNSVRSILKQLNLDTASTSRDSKEGKFMPPTFAWTKSCMAMINKIDNIKGSEDSVWKELLLSQSQFKVRTRNISNFTYNIHASSSTRLTE